MTEKLQLQKEHLKQKIIYPPNMSQVNNFTFLLFGVKNIVELGYLNVTIRVKFVAKLVYLVLNNFDFFEFLGVLTANL